MTDSEGGDTRPASRRMDDCLKLFGRLFGVEVDGITIGLVVVAMMSNSRLSTQIREEFASLLTWYCDAVKYFGRNRTRWASRRGGAQPFQGAGTTWNSLYNYLVRLTQRERAT